MRKEEKRLYVCAVMSEDGRREKQIKKGEERGKRDKEETSKGRGL